MRFALPFLIVGLTVPPAVAQTTYTWNGGGVDSNWSTAANWGGTAPPTNLTDTVIRLAGTTNTSTVADAGLPTSGNPAAFEMHRLEIAANAGPFTVTSGLGGTQVLRINGNGGGIVVESVNAADHTLATTIRAGGSTGTHTWTHNGSGLLSFTGPVIFGGAGFIINGSGNVSVSGVMSSGGGFNGISYAGTGTLTLSAANTYGGFTNVVQGTVKLMGGNNRLPTNTTIRLGGGTGAFTGILDLFGTSQQLFGLTTLNNLVDNRVVSTAVGAVGTLRMANITDQSFVGTLGGTGGNGFGLTKVENGVFSLTGVNTYSGPTLIQSGTVKLSGTGSIANSTVITVGEVTNATAFLDVATTGTNALTGGVNFDANTGQFALAPGQTLQGAGRGVVGGVTVRAGSTVQGFANGTSLNTLTVSGNVTINANGTVAPPGVLRTWVRDTGTAVTNTTLAVAGLGNDLNFANVATGSSKFGLEVRNVGGMQLFQPYTITIATAVDQIQRNGTPVGGSFTFDAGDYMLTSPDFPAFASVSLFTVGNQLRLTFTPVPEPGTVFALGATALGLFGTIRRTYHNRQAV